MPITVSKIIEELEKIAPPKLASDWDNIGLLVGDRKKIVKCALLSLDITDCVIEEAISNDVDLIITHHPMLFKPISKITTDTPLGRRIIKLIENKISVYSMHTNLDACVGGTNEVLCEMLELTDIEPIIYDGLGAMGRIGRLSEKLTPTELVDLLKKILKCDLVRLCVSSTSESLEKETEKEIEKVVVCAGSGSKLDYFIEASKKGCQCFITGDTRYHEMQDAVDLGMCVIDATHYATEQPVINKLFCILSDFFKSQNITLLNSKKSSQIYK